VAEFAQPPGSQDEHWVVDGLTAARDALPLLWPDLKRVENAAVAAARRAGRCRTPLAAMRQPLIVRVLTAGTLEGGTAAGGWGFFVLERNLGGVEGTDARLDQPGRPIGRCIELYLYTEGGPA
jgi:hypothetical protein